MVKVTLIPPTSGHASPTCPNILKTQNPYFPFIPVQKFELFVYTKFQTGPNFQHESCSPPLSAPSGETFFVFESSVRRDTAMPVLARCGRCRCRHGSNPRAPLVFGHRRCARLGPKSCPGASPSRPYPPRGRAPPESRRSTANRYRTRRQNSAAGPLLHNTPQLRSPAATAPPSGP